MKKKSANRPYYSSRQVRPYAYPNAAEPGYFLAKLLDGITAACICMGTVTLFMFLITF